MLWLCVAHEKEIPDFYALGQADVKPVILGVGQFESLTNFARLTATEKPERVILAGSCGIQHDGNLFMIYTASHFAFPKTAHEELPEFMLRTIVTEPAVQFPDLAGATVLQNHGVSIDTEKFRQNTGYIPPEYPQTILENMEAASLAFACSKLGVPFSALLCVTNRIGPNARAEWKQNFRNAGTKLRAILEK